MEMSLQRLAAVWVGKAGRTRRRPASSAPRCESLEGRQLLSTTTLYRANVAPMLTQRAYPAQVSTGGMVNAGRLGKFQRMNFASPDGVQDGQGAVLNGRRLHNMGTVGNGRGVGLRNNVRMARLQAMPGNLSGATTLTMADLNGSTQPGGTPQSFQVTTEPADVAAEPTQVVSATPVPFDAAATSLAYTDCFVGGAGGGLSGRFEPGTLVKDVKAADDPVSKAFEKLHTDIQAIQDKSEVTPKLLAAVRNDVKAIEEAAKTEPGEEALKTFMADVQALDGKLPDDAQRADLVAGFTAVIESRGVTDRALIDKTVADVVAVAQATHITAEDLATIAADHEAIAAATGVPEAEAAVAADAGADASTEAKPDLQMASVTLTKFGPIGQPTEMLLAGLTGGNLSGVSLGGFGPHILPAFDGPHILPAFDGPTSVAPFKVASWDGPYGGGAMGDGHFKVAMAGDQFAPPMGGTFAKPVMAGKLAGPMKGGGQFKVAPGGGAMGNFTYARPMGGVPFGGPWGY